MKKGKLSSILLLAALAAVGVAFVVLMAWGFNNSPAVRNLFSGDANEVMGEVAAGSPASLAARTRMAAWVSMLIFSVISALQLLAFGIGAVVVRGIRISADSVAPKLKQLDNAGIFFDVPLYVGLFGTVSAFLVMTFSPQSSRLIAYSSTLIGIVFSLLLKLTMEYPYRKSLLAESEKNEEA